MRYIEFGQILKESLKNGVTKPKNIRGAGVKMISMGEIFKYSRIQNVEMDRVPVTEKEIQNFGIHQHDLLFARQSLVWEGAGKCSIIASCEVDTVFESHLIRARIDESIANPYYVYYYFNSKHGRENIKTIVEQVAAAGIRGSDLIKLRIPLPEIQIQNKIVNILIHLDKKIDTNCKINDNLHQQAFAFFDQLLSEASDSNCQVSEIAYLNPKRSIKKDQVARCIDMSQLSTSAAFPSGWEMKPFAGGMRFANGDTLLARITPCLENGKTAYIDFLDTDEIAFGSTEYIVLAPKDGIPPEYLYCLARYPSFVEYAVKNMNGSSGRQRVSADTIGQFVMPRPSDNALNNFGNVVSALFAQMRNNSFENIRLEALRDALLPRLISGEIDVSNVQI